jgi:hypothetical protein
MTAENQSVDAPHDKRHDAWAVSDEPCVLLDWSRGANYAERVG